VIFHPHEEFELECKIAAKYKIVGISSKKWPNIGN